MDVDEHGRAVLTFYSEAVNLSRAQLLHDLIYDMWKSGHWRDYSDALGRHRWLECEFDYFLVACNIKRHDAYGVFSYNRDGPRLAEAMESADPQKRRTLASAAANYRSPGPENLADAAVRLGWVSTSGEMIPAVPARALSLARTGLTLDERARRARATLVGDRRRVLDDIVADLTSRITEVRELRYIVDQLRAVVARDRGGRPAANHGQWARDVAQFNGDAAALAEHWGLSRRRTFARMAECRKRRDVSSTAGNA